MGRGRPHRGVTRDRHGRAALLVWACLSASALRVSLLRAQGVVDPAATRAPPPHHVCAAWETLGRGVSVRRCDGGNGHAAALFSGWAITTASSRRWAETLYDARLAALGVSTLYAVDGPAQVDFRRKEISLDALLADLSARASNPDAWVLAVAHSSGAHVAATLFDRAFRVGRAPALRDRVVYVDLDGDRGIAGDPERRLTRESVAGLRRVIFVSVEDRARGLRGFSRAAMEEGHREFPSQSVHVTSDAAGSGCSRDACAHLALIDTRPSARGNETYARCDAATVNISWLRIAQRWLTARR